MMIKGRKSGKRKTWGGHLKRKLGRHRQRRATSRERKCVGSIWALRKGRARYKEREEARESAKRKDVTTKQSIAGTKKD